MRLRLVLSAVIAASCSLLSADTLTLNLCPAGTTSNQNIWGTTIDPISGEATWAAKGNYRDYQFVVQSDGTPNSYFDNISVLLTATLRNQTSNSNSL